jgi:hypothetical protein
MACSINTGERQVAMTERVKISTSGQEAVLATPSRETRGPGVVVIQGGGASTRRSLGGAAPDAAFWRSSRTSITAVMSNADEAAAMMNAGFQGRAGSLRPSVRPRASAVLARSRSPAAGRRLSFATAVNVRGLCGRAFYSLPDP